MLTREGQRGPNISQYRAFPYMSILYFPIFLQTPSLQLVQFHLPPRQGTQQPGRRRRKEEGKLKGHHLRRGSGKQRGEAGPPFPVPCRRRSFDPNGHLAIEGSIAAQRRRLKGFHRLRRGRRGAPHGGRGGEGQERGGRGGGGRRRAAHAQEGRGAGGPAAGGGKRGGGRGLILAQGKAAGWGRGGNACVKRREEIPYCQGECKISYQEICFLVFGIVCRECKLRIKSRYIHERSNVISYFFLH